MTNSELTYLVILADRSGSMHGIASDMNGAIRELLKDQAKQPGKCLVDVVVFDQEIDILHEGALPQSVRSEVIHPRGSTALNDALGQTIVRLGEKFSAMEEDDRPGHVIFVVVTDGFENSSREYKHEDIKAMVEEQTGKWGWTFIYLAANVDAFATGSAYGFAAAQTMNYAPTARGVHASTMSTSSLVSDIRAGGSGVYTDTDREEAMGA